MLHLLSNRFFRKIWVNGNRLLIDPGFPNKRRTKIGMPSMPGMGRHEIQLSQKISMPGMPAMKTKFVPRLSRLSKRKIIRAQATLGARRCLSVHPKLRYTGHSNFRCMPLKTFNSQSSPLASVNKRRKIRHRKSRCMRQMN